ncbi:hypothetical protein D9613_012093 [Agrocybe pediades]|uniref:Cytochrome P450 n=1 Tax=Agrocybe pediades TaxID=84607 RepID=A0A8H4R3L7_9AGAR|nr:hypothetical protein D9613_012093 [Agrocybe pediades]
MVLETSTILTAALGFLGAYGAYVWLNAVSTAYKLRHIPTIGSSGIITSYIDAYRYLSRGHEMIQEGYKKFHGNAFKIPLMSRWLVIVSGPQMLEDIRRADNDLMSFDEAVKETIQTDYTMGKHLRKHPFHIATVRTPLTRNIAVRFGDIKDEVQAAFADILPQKDDWTAVPALGTVMQVVVRTSNRLFVGLPLCRNPDYMALNIEFTIDVMQRATKINKYPAFLKPIAGRLLTKVHENLKRMLRHVGPMIEEQLEQERLYGRDREDRPNNLISWLLEDAPEENRTVEDFAMRILTINFAAIHTTSQALTQAIYDLAAHPEYIAPLREEVENVIQAEGWTKLSMGKMRKVDSFIKESQRMAIGAVQLSRKLLKDFTFSNGLTLPAGTHVAVATNATHMDENIYENPHEFNGFRFLNMRDEDGENIKHQIVSLSPESLTFGTGRHACPGRFFAANELKCMLGFIVLNYDVKLPDGMTRPESSWSQGRIAPNNTAKVLFRKRQD